MYSPMGCHKDSQSQLKLKYRQDVQQKVCNNKSNKNEFTIIHSNINSLRGHINLLRHYVGTNKIPEVITISETKLSPNNEDSTIELGNYTLYRRNRSEYGGGDIIDKFNNKVIIGDFNADKTSNSADYEFLSNFATENSLRIVPYGPTFHYKDGDSELDVFMVHELNDIISFSKSEEPFVNSHDLIKITLNNHSSRNQNLF